MSLKEFTDSFEQTLQKDVIEKSVKLTSGVAFDFISKLIYKPKIDAETQTSTMK